MYWPSDDTSFNFQIVADKRICDATSQTSAAVSLLYIIVVTPWAVQQVIISCTRTIVSQ